MEMGKMVIQQLTEYQDIIQVYDQKVAEKVEKRLIRQMLKSIGALDNVKGTTTHLKGPKHVQNAECGQCDGIIYTQ